MLSESEIKICAAAYALRHDEAGVDLWFALEDELLPEAHRLVEQGYLDRRWHRYRRKLRQRCDLVYRLSDQAMQAQEVTRLIDVTGREN